MLLALLHHVELPYGAFLHQLLGPHVLGREADGLRVHQLHLALLAGVDDGVRIFQGVGDRLLEDDVLPGFRGGDHDLAVEVVRDPHHNHVNILAIEQLPVVGRVGGDFPLARERFHVGLARRADRDEHRLRDFLKCLGVDTRRKG